MPEPAKQVLIEAGDYRDVASCYVVWLRPGRLNWPPGCSCCLALEPNHRLMTLQGRTIIYPLCAPCLRHCVVDDIGTGIAVVVGLIVPGVAYASFFGLTYLRGSLYVTGVLYLMAALAVGWVVHRLITRTLCAPGPTCASGEWPVTEFDLKNMENTVELIGETSSRRKLLTRGREIAQAEGAGLVALNMTNTEFVRQFISANGGDPSQIASPSRAAGP